MTTHGGEQARAKRSDWKDAHIHERDYLDEAKENVEKTIREYVLVHGDGKVFLELTGTSVAYDNESEHVGAYTQQTCQRLKINLNHQLKPLEQEEEVELSAQHAEFDLFCVVFLRVAIGELGAKIALGYRNC